MNLYVFYTLRIISYCTLIQIDLKQYYKFIVNNKFITYEFDAYISF